VAAVWAESSFRATVPTGPYQFITPHARARRPARAELPKRMNGIAQCKAALNTDERAIVHKPAPSATNPP